jgi:hypothetical protein
MVVNVQGSFWWRLERGVEFKLMLELGMKLLNMTAAVIFITNHLHLIHSLEVPTTVVLCRKW